MKKRKIPVTVMIEQYPRTADDKGKRKVRVGVYGKNVAGCLLAFGLEEPAVSTWANSGMLFFRFGTVYTEIAKLGMTKAWEGFGCVGTGVLSAKTHKPKLKRKLKRKLKLKRK